MDVTRDELLEAVRQALEATPENPEGALTTWELYDITGRGVNSLRRTLRRMKEAGLIESVKIWRENLAGDMQQVPAYRLRRQDDSHNHNHG